MSYNTYVNSERLQCNGWLVKQSVCLLSHCLRSDNQAPLKSKFVGKQKFKTPYLFTSEQ
jgi:hypothetical protein